MPNTHSEHGLRFNRRQGAAVGHSRCGRNRRSSVRFARENYPRCGRELQYATVSRCKDATRKVRGFVDKGVLTFKGVPYGASTGGENRWLLAKPPTSWDGEYPDLTYGANCPQRRHNWSSEQTFLFQWTDGWQSEDMLKVNIWTPGLTGKRPVIFCTVSVLLIHP